ncbi:hypothetical protein FRB98_002496 [Tulasnella sp. 332]|nr:hypothetical protein FRB98_002496 [Tulasnella sp. 332]
MDNFINLAKQGYSAYQASQQHARKIDIQSPKSFDPSKIYLGICRIDPSAPSGQGAGHQSHGGGHQAPQQYSEDGYAAPSNNPPPSQNPSQPSYNADYATQSGGQGGYGSGGTQSFPSSGGGGGGGGQQGYGGAAQSYGQSQGGGQGGYNQPSSGYGGGQGGQGAQQPFDDDRYNVGNQAPSGGQGGYGGQGQNPGQAQQGSYAGGNSNYSGQGQGQGQQDGYSGAGTGYGAPPTPSGGGLSAPSGNDYHPASQIDHSYAVQQATQHTGGQDSSYYQNAVNHINSGAPVTPSLDHDRVESDHAEAYGGNPSSLPAAGMGAAAAMQAFKMFTSGGAGGAAGGAGGAGAAGGGDMKSKMLSMAMSEASKLFDAKGGAASGTKQDAVNGAAQTVMKLFMQSKMGNAGGSGAAPPGGLGSMLSMAR